LEKILIFERTYPFTSRLLNTSLFTRLPRWLGSLPEDAVSGNPLLLMVQAFLRFELGPDSDAYTDTEQARRKADPLPAESQDASTNE
jgi:hypothetical protein